MICVACVTCLICTDRSDYCFCLSSFGYGINSQHHLRVGRILPTIGTSLSWGLAVILVACNAVWPHSTAISEVSSCSEIMRDTCPLPPSFNESETPSERRLKDLSLPRDYLHRDYLHRDLPTEVSNTASVQSRSSRLPPSFHGKFNSFYPRSTFVIKLFKQK
jgi:hypothetical protein